jgi:hypothetical protein
MTYLPDEMIKRRRAVEFAVENTRIEGGTITPEIKVLMDRWAAGEMTDDDLMAAVTGGFDGAEEAS